jgi:type II secretion system protein H
MRGFSLVEVLVVLALMALFASVAGVGLARPQTGQLDEEAERLSAWLQAARERALLDGGTYAVRRQRTDLQLVFYHDYAWHVVADTPDWRPDPATRLVIEGSEPSAAQALLLVFHPAGTVAFSARLRLQRPDGARTLQWVPVADSTVASRFTFS